MRDKLSKKLKIFRRAAEGSLLFLALYSLALAEGVNQNTAYLDTDAKNRVASDDSLQHSTNYAMRALMDLGNLNVKSAVNNGMTAYGKYRNSETLDKLGDLNYNQASALGSVGSAAPAPRKTDTTFRRLDPSFLQKGETAKVAAEFEQKSGMSRKTFLNQLSEISEKKIPRSDPQLVDKVLGRFENFIAKIPNKDFRENLQKGVNMVPDSMRTGIISKAVAKFSTLAAGVAAAPVPAPLAAPTESEAPQMVTGLAEEPAPEAASADPSLSPAEPARNPAAEEANPLGNIIQAAIDTQAQDPTIFQLISRRYRLLTPGITTR